MFRPIAGGADAIADAAFLPREASSATLGCCLAHRRIEEVLLCRDDASDRLLVPGRLYRRMTIRAMGLQVFQRNVGPSATFQFILPVYQELPP